MEDRLSKLAIEEHLFLIIRPLLSAMLPEKPFAQEVARCKSFMQSGVISPGVDHATHSAILLLTQTEDFDTLASLLLCR